MGCVFDRFIMAHLSDNSVKKVNTRDTAYLYTCITETSYYSYVYIKIINLNIINL